VSFFFRDMYIGSKAFFTQKLKTSLAIPNETPR
jgi:hypothetical protein